MSRAHSGEDSVRVVLGIGPGADDQAHDTLARTIPRKAQDPDLIERINLARSAAGLSIKELAEVATVPFGTLTKYLSGHHALPARVLPGIANAFDVSADWLLTGEPARLHPKALKRTMGYLQVTSAATGNADEMARQFYMSYCQGYLWRFGKSADLDLWFVDFYRRLNADDSQAPE